MEWSMKPLEKKNNTQILHLGWHVFQDVNVSEYIYFAFTSCAYPNITQA